MYPCFGGLVEPNLISLAPGLPCKSNITQTNLTKFNSTCLIDLTNPRPNDLVIEHSCLLEPHPIHIYPNTQRLLTIKRQIIRPNTGLSMFIFILFDEYGYRYRY